MAYIDLPPAPGIVALFEFRPETAKPLRDLAEALLRGPSPLSSAERELIAARVSWLNDCMFCFKSHAAAAAALLGVGLELLEDIPRDFERTPITPKLRALLKLAEKVREHGHAVSIEDVAIARAAGASDVELHDTVAIAAAFCMFNRYVDGLRAPTSPRNEDYLEMGQMLATRGYRSE